MTAFAPRKTTTERVKFRNAAGQYLAGLIDRPEGQPRLTAIASHCFTCTKDFPAIAHVSRGLARRGITVLRFDFTGLGGSDGSFAETSFSTTVEDVHAAARYLREVRTPAQLLVGHSWGGAASLVAATELDEIRATATIASPSDPGHVLEHFPNEVAAARETGSAQMAIAGRSYALTRTFIEDLDRGDFAERLAAHEGGLLVMHSPADAVVSIEHAEKLYKAVRGPRSFVSLPGMDHVLSRRGDPDYVAGIISAWVDRYL